jgi:tetratricopeptide (TPR) repeat protein
MRRPALFAGMGLMLVYVLGLAPSVHVHDAGELTAAAWTLGIGHPPGAPLYMLLHKAFLLLVPLGHLAWRANLFSAVMALAAFFLVEALAFALTKKKWLSASAALAFALSTVFWSQAGMAEVYTLQAALLAGFLLAFVRARERGTSMAAPAFLWGLLLTCHMGLALVSPLVWMALIHPREKGWKPRAIRACRTGLWMAAPLALYLYLPLRSLADPSVDWGNPETLQNFWWHLTNRQVRGRMLSLPADLYLRRAGEYGLLLLKNLHLLLPFAAIGIWKRRRDHGRLLLMLGALLLMDAAFVVLMDTAPLASEAYAIPSVLALAVMAVLGLDVTAHRAWAVIPALAAVVSFVSAHGVNNLSGNFIIRDTAEGVLQQAPRGAVLFTQEDNTTNPLAYLVEVEGARRDLEIYDRQGHFFRSLHREPLYLVPSGALPAYRKDAERLVVEEALRTGKPVVFTSPFLEYRPAGWSLIPFGTLGLASPDGQRTMPVLAVLPPRHGHWKTMDWMSRQMQVEAAVREANAALAEGRLEDAKSHMGTASLAEIPEQCLRVAQLYLQMNDPAPAALEARRAVHEAPGLAPAWSLLGYALLRQNKLDAAESALRRAVELDSSLPQPHASLGSLAAGRGDYRSAARAFHRSLKLEPAQPEVARLERMAAVCADVMALQGLVLSGPDLERLLVGAASAGFPNCVRDWLGRHPVRDGREQELIHAYLRAEDAARGRGGNNSR